jgi:hypothetical protein
VANVHVISAVKLRGDWALAMKHEAINKLKTSCFLVIAI